ncbi:MAG: TonB-dependent siderophore receptor [Parcubacteria group bacterium]|nr:TonB-dependent siderophore receptor [Parcubacteria group bacterium]
MAKTIAIIFGVVFVLVGVLGFVPNPLVGPTGLFETDTLHNLVHLLFGIILLAVAFMAPAVSSLWLKILGVVYLLLAVLGFLTIDMGGELFGLVHMNHADHWLHVFLGVVLLLAGFLAKDAGRMTTTYGSSLSEPM